MLLEGDRRGDAVAFFLADMLPDEMIEDMRQSPEWPIMEAVAPTIAYDNAVMGDGSPPVEDAQAATMPALVLEGGASLGFMHEAAEGLAKAMPQAERQTLECQSHRPKEEALAAVLAAFFRT